MGKKESGLSAFNLTMLALGTIVGGSFFLGSAIAIRTAGPAIIVSYILGGALVYIILFSLSEMTVADADPGSFRTFSERAFGRGAGFTVGWVYWTGMVLAMSSEAIAASALLNLWFPGISIPLLGLIIIIGVTLLNMLGAEKLSKLESGLAALKLLAIIGFIVIAAAVVSGLFIQKSPTGLGALKGELIFPAGIQGIAGSMLIVMFTYAGFEIIGLAASETSNPHKTIPRAITYTVLSLVGLYTVAIIFILPFVKTSALTDEASPMVTALGSAGIGWAADVINVVLITAILSTMLAATFALGRMMRSLTDEGFAPAWIKDKGDIPYRGILFSGAAMSAGLTLGFILPRQIYLFLVSSGGVSLLFTYFVIVATHYRFRKKTGCPPKGNCQLPGFPYTSWAAIASMLLIIISMPLIPGQGTGLIAGIVLVAFFVVSYNVVKYSDQFLDFFGIKHRKKRKSPRPNP